jgi:hypothetical protein
MKNIFLIPTLIMIISCSDSKENNNLSQGIIVAKSISIELKNNEGSNLLGSNEYPVSDIAATYLVNGKIVQNNSPHDYPNNVLFYNKNQGTQVFLNDSSSEEFPITYIKWNKTESDTIKAHYNRANSSIIIDKLWIFENNNWKEINLKSMPLTLVK